MFGKVNLAPAVSRCVRMVFRSLPETLKPFKTIEKNQKHDIHENPFFFGFLLFLAPIGSPCSPGVLWVFRVLWDAEDPWVPVGFQGSLGSLRTEGRKLTKSSITATSLRHRKEGYPKHKCCGN